MCQNMHVLPKKVARPSVSPARERTDPHELRSLRTKVEARLPNRIPRTTQSPTPNRQDPYSRKLFGELQETVKS